ncbi:MAG TPA: hypothetical protein VFG04_15335 [Planctomycetaceae bacterium]|jgi:hypothetical protein|nr:hypothetical protein [Planctomycetaceae bacterium]
MAESDGRLPSETVPFQTVQIIAAALIVGPLVFAGIAFVSNLGQAPGDETLGYIAVGFSALALIMSLVIPKIATNQKLRTLGVQGSEVTTTALFAAFQTQVIIRSALLEGAAFFCCVAYMATHVWWTLGTALALLAVMAVFFPTRGRFDDWVREQRELRSFEGRSDVSSTM